MAEDAARELPKLTLEEALHLVHLNAERGSPKLVPHPQGEGRVGTGPSD